MSCENFDVDNIKFGKPCNVETMFGSFKIVPISYVQDGKEEKLVMITDKCFSWGVQRDNLGDTLKLPIVLENKDMETNTLQPTAMQTSFLNATRKIVEETIGRFDLEQEDLKKLGNFVYVKKDKGEVVKDCAPTLYAKVRYNSKNKSLFTRFRKKNGKELLPLKELMRQRCYVRAAICFEGIFVNNSVVSLQVRVDEAIVEPIERKEKSNEYVIPVDEEE